MNDRPTDQKRISSLTLAGIVFTLVLLASVLPLIAMGAESDEELAKKLANPIASLISVPLQYNYDNHFGSSDDGSVSRLNIQPVIPFALNDK